MKTILHLNASDFYGGPEKQIVEHLRRLDRQNYRGIVVSFVENERENEIIRRAKEYAIPAYPIPVKSAFDVTAFSKIRKILMQENVDLLCTHGFKSVVTGWLVARKLNINVLAFSRGYTTENKKVAFYEWLERRILKRVKAIISVSSGQKNKLEKQFGILHHSHHVVHNAVDTNTSLHQNNDFRGRFFRENKLPENAVLAVSAGRLSPEKGHTYLVKAIAELQDGCQDLYFIFCGDGLCQDDLINQAQSLGIYDKCRFLGFRDDVTEIFKIMDFMVLPSLTEGLPNVILESFSVGKTVLASEVGGVPELVINEYNGLLIEAADTSQLSRGCERLFKSNDLRNEFGKNALETVKSKFSFDKQNIELETIYRKLLAT